MLPSKRGCHRKDIKGAVFVVNAPFWKVQPNLSLYMAYYYMLLGAGTRIPSSCCSRRARPMLTRRIRKDKYGQTPLSRAAARERRRFEPLNILRRGGAGIFEASNE